MEEHFWYKCRVSISLAPACDSEEIQVEGCGLSLTSLQMWIVVPGMKVFLRHELLNVTSCLPETKLFSAFLVWKGEWVCCTYKFWSAVSDLMFEGMLPVSWALARNLREKEREREDSNLKAQKVDSRIKNLKKQPSELYRTRSQIVPVWLLPPLIPT